MSQRSSDDLDNDHTDELPVLLETVVLDDERRFAADAPENTGEHTALYRTAEPLHASGAQVALAEHAAEVADLQSQVATLMACEREREHLLAEKDALIADLRGNITAARQSAEAASAAERRLATQLAVRDARVAELTAAIEKLQDTANAEQVEMTGLRSAAATARQEAAALKKELSDLAPAVPAPATASQLQELLEANATLQHYVEGRRAWWDEMQANQAALVAKIGPLEEALAAAAKRALDAEAFAARESSRAIALRADLVESARRVADLERDLRDAQDRASVTAVPADPPPPIAAESTAAATSHEAPVENSPEDSRTTERRSPAPAPTLDAAPAEALAQLEGEVEYKRQQIAAQLVELHDRDQRLLAAASDLERLRRDSSAWRNELDESRSTIARLERTVIDKDRALDARDARIATLQEELNQRLGVIEKLHAIDSSLSKLEAGGAARASATDTAADSPAPALICLTGDAPKRFALTRPTTTVGRGPHCDLQILTHFVSREHARISLNGDAVVIEDLGSRNGVFVNSVRVDQQALQQGDLVTIGETQFRFLESMAH